MFQCPVFRSLHADLGGETNPNHPIPLLLENMINSLLDAEMDIFLERQLDQGMVNKRNGKIYKRVRSHSGLLNIRTPRDRRGDFRPKLIPKWVKDVSIPMEAILLCLYSRHNPEETVAPALAALYGGDFDDASLDRLSGAAVSCIQKFRTRPLEAHYPMIFVQTYDVGNLAGKFALCPDEWLAIFAQNAAGGTELLYLYDWSHVHWPDIIENLKQRGLSSFRSMSSDLQQPVTAELMRAFGVNGIERTEMVIG